MSTAAAVTTPFSVGSFRAAFPSLASGIAHFDGPGGTQTPAVVGQAIADTLTGPLSNRGTSVSSERNADAVVGAFRAAYADFLALPAGGIVYGRSATQLTYDFSRALAKTWTTGDEVLVSRLDHDANVRPWVQAAEAAGAVVRWIDIDPATGELDAESMGAAIGERTRLVAVTAASNLIGTRPDIAAVADRVHAVGALLYVDGVHAAAHTLIDVPALGADFFVCSPYKFFGPHCGVLAASPELLDSIHPDKLLPSTDVVPERFEFGTLPYEIMAGATAAVDFIASWGAGDSRRARLVTALEIFDDRETALRERLETGLAELGAVLHSRASSRTPTLLVTFPGSSMQEASAFLAAQDVLAPSGTFYALEPAQRLGLPAEGGLRVGVAAYTSDDDVDRLIAGLRKFRAR
ncbi:cysteine desulfurase-like protein [Nakamurella sp. A5-74]|uniref:Cysteine desulfurase-like protein n=1 Tax=Nakamurella sp. A5-74 TaxID=3158264 RepID=A0AAU8DMJ7_9ACTN